MNLPLNPGHLALHGSDDGHPLICLESSLSGTIHCFEDLRTVLSWSLGHDGNKSQDLRLNIVASREASMPNPDLGTVGFLFVCLVWSTVDFWWGAEACVSAALIYLQLVWEIALQLLRQSALPRWEPQRPGLREKRVWAEQGIWRKDLGLDPGSMAGGNTT